MWLIEGGVATIVPLKVLEKIWSVTYNSRHHGGSFVIHTDQGETIVKYNSKGMPDDLQELDAKVVLLFVQIMCGNMEGYTRCKVEEACIACKAQAMLGHPTNCNFLGMVRSGMILNCFVTPNRCAKH
jgi:hypothetical protein